MKFITSYFLYSDKVLFEDFDQCNVFDVCETLEEAIKLRNKDYGYSVVIVEVIAKETSENSAEIQSQQIVKQVLPKHQLKYLKR